MTPLTIALVAGLAVWVLARFAAWLFNRDGASALALRWAVETVAVFLFTAWWGWWGYVAWVGLFLAVRILGPSAKVLWHWRDIYYEDRT